MKDRIYIDAGTTKGKVLIASEGKFVQEEIEGQVTKENFYALKRRFPKGKFYIIGSGSSNLKGEEEVSLLDEISCNAYLSKYCNIERALVVNSGTGTSFSYYDQGKISHLLGTGLGGGTIRGMGELLLGMHTMDEVDELAQKGVLQNINIQIADLYSENLGFLDGEITVSNFAKNAKREEDIAVGIYSLVIEPILSLANAYFKEEYTVIFSGGVFRNKTARNILDKHKNILPFPYFYFSAPSYGTCYGAYALTVLDTKIPLPLSRN